MTPVDLTQQALDVNDANLRLGNEVFEAAGATFVRNRGAPDIYDANHVASIRVTSPAAVDQLFARVEQEFEGYRHRRFHTDHRTHPSVIARLHLEDYDRAEGLVMMLAGDLIGAPKEFEIRSVDTDAEWAAFEGLKSEDWIENRRKQGLPLAPEVAIAMARVNRAKCPPAQYFLAWADGRGVAYFNAWVGLDGTGQVEDLFTLPEYRHRGIATALLHHCVAACRAGGAQRVVIVADPSDTPKHMYSAMGFRPIAVNAHYWKRLEGA